MEKVGDPSQEGFSLSAHFFVCLRWRGQKKKKRHPVSVVGKYGQSMGSTTLTRPRWCLTVTHTHTERWGTDHYHAQHACMSSHPTSRLTTTAGNSIRAPAVHRGRTEPTGSPRRSAGQTSPPTSGLLLTVVSGLFTDRFSLNLLCSMLYHLCNTTDKFHLLSNILRNDFDFFPRTPCVTSQFTGGEPNQPALRAAQPAKPLHQRPVFF